MNKRELIEKLQPFTDECEIVVSNDASSRHMRHDIHSTAYELTREGVGQFVLVSVSIDGL